MGKNNISFCQEIRYREFPDMLFGAAKNNSLYFDASLYITKKGDPSVHSIGNFMSKFSFWIEAILKMYDLREEDIVIKDEVSGNFLIEESLSLIFTAYLDPEFAVYMLERISEMLITGIVLSDSALIRMAGERISKEDLN